MGGNGRRSISEVVGGGVTPINAAPARLKAHGAAPGHADGLRGTGGGAHFLDAADGLDPEDVGAALFQPLGLFGEDRRRLSLGQAADRAMISPVGPIEPAITTALAGGLARPRARGGRRCGSCRADAVLRAGQTQPGGIGAKAVGQDDIATAAIIWLCSARTLSGWLSFHRSGA